MLFNWAVYSGLDMLSGALSIAGGWGSVGGEMLTVACKKAQACAC